MATKCKSRNYSVREKQYFVKILQKYSHIIENKKSSASSLQEKEEAWEAIIEQYNSSSIVTEQKCVKQLKKLWTNLKQTQRDALTKERQSRFLTGGGPPSDSASVDPEISMIVPNLMTTAPVMFSSSLDDNTLERRKNQVIGDATNEVLHEILDEVITHELSEDALSYAMEVIESPVEEENDVPEISHPASQVIQPDVNVVTMRPSTSSSISTVRKSRRTRTTNDLDHTEKELKVRRLQSIMRQETEMFLLKKRQEEELHEIAKAKSAFDLRAAEARAELAELLLTKEKNQ